MKRETLETLLRDREAKTAVALVTDLDSGVQTLVYHDRAEGADAEDADVAGLARAAMRDDRSRLHEIGERRVFVEVQNPPKRLIIVGAVHIAQPLARMAAEAGYAVTVVDPRRAFASEARFSGVALLSDWPDDALAELAPDARTAIVTLTHDPKIDDPALHTALRSPAFYVGALGSRRTHAARVERLTAAGFAEEELARIHAPVGLDIGAVSPAEIAVAVLAQITDVLHRKSGNPA